VSNAADAGSPGSEPDRPAPGLRMLRRHLLLFLGVNATLNLVNYFVGTGWWAFWPLAAWSILFMIHYLRYKAATVDEQWVDDRAAELRLKSYDRDHIEKIAAHGPGAAARNSEPERK